MPIIRVEILAGRTQEQKTTYVKELIRLTTEVLRCQADYVDVIFTEIDPGNWAHGGQAYETKD